MALCLCSEKIKYLGTEKIKDCCKLTRNPRKALCILMATKCSSFLVKWKRDWEEPVSLTTSAAAWAAATAASAAAFFARATVIANFLCFSVASSINLWFLCDGRLGSTGRCLNFRLLRIHLHLNDLCFQNKKMKDFRKCLIWKEEQKIIKKTKPSLFLVFPQNQTAFWTKQTS